MAATLTTPNTLLGTIVPKAGTDRVLSNIAMVLVGTLLITISAKISVQIGPVPVTLQTFAVAAVAGAYGSRLGVAAVIAYLLEGLIGAPVFSGALAGPAYLMGPTGGFLVGFIPMAYIAGLAAERTGSARVVVLAVAMLVGDAVAFGLGYAWLVKFLTDANVPSPATTALSAGVTPFIIWDVLKMVFAAVSVTGLWAILRKRA
jgi:biotin transport system substrate-specific component